MADAKGGYLSADEFLSAIAGELIDHEVEINGRVVGKVQLRSLGLLDVQNAIAAYKNDSGGLVLWALDNGLVSPTLTEEQREGVRAGKPGPLLSIAKHIMQVSGMTEGDGATPLDGGGSQPE